MAADGRDTPRCDQGHDVKVLSDFWDTHVETVEKRSEDDPFATPQ